MEQRRLGQKPEIAADTRGYRGRLPAMASFPLAILHAACISDFLVNRLGATWQKTALDIPRVSSWPSGSFASGLSHLHAVHLFIYVWRSKATSLLLRATGIFLRDLSAGPVARGICACTSARSARMALECVLSNDPGGPAPCLPLCRQVTL